MMLKYYIGDRCTSSWDLQRIEDMRKCTPSLHCICAAQTVRTENVSETVPSTTEESSGFFSAEDNRIDVKDSIQRLSG